jgi:lysophospholipase L1-like esterase
MSLCKEIQANVMTYFESKDYAKKKDATRIMMIAMDEKFKTPNTGPCLPFPDYADHLAKVQAKFLDYFKNNMKNDKDKTLLFGDSIAAQAIDYISDVVNPKLNWARGGFRAGHMQQLLSDMLPLIKSAGFVPKTIVVGTPDGNGLLQHYEINVIKAACNNLLNTLRAAFPTAKIVIYGLPMTVVDYAMINFIPYDANLYQWVLNDKNSVMLPLIKQFVEGGHIMMKADYSSDGVHLSPKGQVLFGKLIKRAKTDTPINRLINCY